MCLWCVLLERIAILPRNQKVEIDVPISGRRQNVVEMEKLFVFMNRSVGRGLVSRIV